MSLFLALLAGFAAGAAIHAAWRLATRPLPSIGTRP